MLLPARGREDGARFGAARAADDTAAMAREPKSQGVSMTERIPKSAMRNPEVLNEAYHYPKTVSFSRGMRVELDGCVMLYISGTASVDENGRSVHPGDVEAQSRRVFDNIKGLLKAEGADWHDVVRTTCYLCDFRYYDVFNAVRNNFYFQERLDPFPASTCVQAQMCRPELLVEIEAIAIIPRNRSR